MSMRALGKTDIMVSPIGLGGNKFTGGKGVYGFVMPDLAQEEMNAIVKAALDSGINWIDTAEMYGFGHSEAAIAAALRHEQKQDEDVVIATKWMPTFRTAKNIPRTIDKRIRYLDGYQIDLYMVHFPHGLSSPESEMDAMADLVEAGKIRSVGVSNFSADRMRRAHTALTKRGIPLAVNQVEYSLLNRKIETNGVLDLAKEVSDAARRFCVGVSVRFTPPPSDDKELKDLHASYRFMLERYRRKSISMHESGVIIGPDLVITDIPFLRPEDVQSIEITTATGVCISPTTISTSAAKGGISGRTFCRKLMGTVGLGTGVNVGKGVTVGGGGDVGVNRTGPSSSVEKLAPSIVCLIKSLGNGVCIWKPAAPLMLSFGTQAASNKTADKTGTPGNHFRR